MLSEGGFKHFYFYLVNITNPSHSQSIFLPNYVEEIDDFT